MLIYTDIKIKEMKEHALILQNMFDSTKINRFSFTDKEKESLKFSIELINISLEELEWFLSNKNNTINDLFNFYFL